MLTLTFAYIRRYIGDEILSTRGRINRTEKSEVKASLLRSQSEPIERSSRSHSLQGQGVAECAKEAET